MPRTARHTQRGDGASLARRRKETVRAPQLPFLKAPATRENDQEPGAIGGRQELGFERGRIREERSGCGCRNSQDDPVPLHHGPIGEDQRGTALISFDASNGSLVVNGQARGERPRDRFKPGIRGERNEGTRAVGHHGQRRRRRRLRKILKVVSPKRRADDRAGEGLAKASGTPFVGGHVDVCPVGGISRIGLRQARELTGKLPSRLCGVAPPDHSGAHHRVRGGTVGERRRVNDESGA